MWRRQDHSNPITSAASTAAVESLHPEIVEDRRFVARQAIFDRARKVYGYELLCRSGWENRFVGDSDAATRMMIADGALYGFQELTRGARTFINCTRQSLVEELVTVLPPSTVLEILETVEPDEEVLAACRRLKQKGYAIALDDFRMSPKMKGLVQLADYIKVDFRISDKQERLDLLAALAGGSATLVAEKIETQEEFQMAMDEGFALFQGYFFCHPQVFAKQKAPANGANYLSLLSALSSEHFNIVQMTDLVKTEVTICYQLLRLVNSAAFGVGHEVHSIQDALLLVGEEQFRKLVINAIATETCRHHADELLIHVLQRARFLELMAPYTRERAPEQYLFGLLSRMDVLLGMPLQDVVDLLPLRREMKAALSGTPNAVGLGLRLLESYEEGDWSACAEKASALHLTEAGLSHLYEQSLQWAERAADIDSRAMAKAS